jgi:hypothetical protein
LKITWSSAEMVMIQPIPMNPNLPTLSGPSSHSPLPMAVPRAMRLGPTAYLNASFGPTLGTPQTSSGVGRSVTSSGGRLTPIWDMTPDRFVTVSLTLVPFAWGMFEGT